MSFLFLSLDVRSPMGSPTSSLLRSPWDPLCLLLWVLFRVLLWAPYSFQHGFLCAFFRGFPLVCRRGGLAGFITIHERVREAREQVRSEKNTRSSIGMKPANPPVVQAWFSCGFPQAAALGRPDMSSLVRFLVLFLMWAHVASHITSIKIPSLACVDYLRLSSSLH